MDTAQVLGRLVRAGFQLEIADGRVEYDTFNGPAPDWARSVLASHKAEIRACLGEYTKLAPLTFAQRGLWFLEQLGTHGAAIATYGAFHLTGPLDVEAFRETLRQLVARQEALRTTFTSFDGEPAQRVLPHVEVPLRVVDLQDLPEDKQEDAFKAMSDEEPRVGFDLSESPLVRWTLVQFDEERFGFIFIAHHIVFDGWSTGIFWDEIGALYADVVSDSESSERDLPGAYSKYVHSQRAKATDQLVRENLEFWGEQLEGIPPLLELPADYPRPATIPNDAGLHTIPVEPSLLAELKTLGRQENATLFQTLLAAFNVLLCRYSGSEDITVGVPMADRFHRETRQTIGMFVDTLPLRTDLSGGVSFRGLLERIRKVVSDARGHRRYPVEALVSALNLPREQGYHPIYQTVFVAQFWPTPTMEFSGITWEPIYSDHGPTFFDLRLWHDEIGSTVTTRFAYNADLFSASTIARMADCFVNLLAAVVDDPDKPVSELPIVGGAECHQQLAEWNATKTDYPTGQCLHDLFEAQVERTPDAVALVFEEEQLTYGELNAQTNRLAHYLRDRGVGPDVLVGVCLERSLDLVVALFAIVKAGGAYLPLDPDYPRDRLALMIEDSQAPVVLTRQGLHDVLPPNEESILCLDAHAEAIAEKPANNPSSPATAENLAYLIYTSGSTGKPKGVMNEHRGIVNRILWMQEAFQLTPSDRVLQKTPFSFDVSVWEFFWPLFTGAQLVVARPGGHKDPSYLVETIECCGITTLHFVPSMLQPFLEAPGLDRCRCLKRVICSGEALSTGLQERFFTKLDAELHNLYGPTEAAVDVTHWHCEKDSPLATVPIGHPIANTQVYILDDKLNPVPLGLSGELHIGGVQVARGYLNRPELTAERFIPDPFSETPGARLYKTGDSCRWLPDGNVEFLGRQDNQVKVRGFRVELGEIETAIGRHTSVREAVVVVREDRPGDQRLVAYVAGNEGSEPSIQVLRDFLGEKLPDYMVPSAFLFLDALPVTSNGKVDRRALPAITEVRVDPEGEYVAPRCPVEERLAGIWADVLGAESVGMDDNFFDLGGHSLLVLVLLAQTNAAFDVELPVRIIFDAPTVATMAKHIAEAQAGTHEAALYKTSSVVPIQPRGTNRPFFCVAPASGVVHPYYHVASLLGFQQPFYALEDPRLCAQQSDIAGIEAIAKFHIEAMREVQSHGPYLLGGWSFGGYVAFEMARQLAEQGERVALLALIECEASGKEDAAPRTLMTALANTPRTFATVYSLARASIPYIRDGFYLLASAARARSGHGKEGLSRLDYLRWRVADALHMHMKKKANVSRVLSEDSRLALRDLPAARGVFAVLGANIREEREYTLQSYPGRVTLFSTDSEQTPAARAQDPTLGWTDYASHGVDVHPVPGNHAAVLAPPYVQVLAEKLKACIEKVRP